MEYIIFLLAQSIWWGAMSSKFFVAAGRKSWEAYVPFYNMYAMLKIAQRPWWWLILLLIPVVGIVMTIVLVYEFLHVFGHRKTWQTAAVMLTFGIYLGYLNFYEPIKYIGRDVKAIKAALGDWGNSVFFAVVAATIIRATTFEAYTIPTSSMEKSLMVGDFLFVSKLHYGVRVPMTPISFPLVHNMLPFSTIKSYTEWPSIPYVRLPKFQSIKNGESVVFNWPVDVGPVDKRQNYVKRCVGIPGDTLEIKDRVLFINGEKFNFPGRAIPQYRYYVQTNGTPFSRKELKERFDINYLTNKELRDPNNSQDVIQLTRNEFMVFISDSALAEFSTLPNVAQVLPIITPIAGDTTANQANLPDIVKQIIARDTANMGNPLFPNSSIHNRIFNYSADNFGPLYIPKAGDKIEMNYNNFMRFATVIEKYEGNTLEVRDKSFLINGEVATTYTFKMNYYWMMGDNRHNSLDSRYWGYVPEDHIVGKPVFIWMSWDKYGEGLNKIRFDRIFTTVHGEGKRITYFWYVLAIAIGWWAFSQWRNRGKAPAAKA
jgi:signal peptidase I